MWKLQRPNPPPRAGAEWVQQGGDRYKRENSLIWTKVELRFLGAIAVESPQNASKYSALGIPYSNLPR